ncbi:hypothetical protein ABLN74_16750, partial [Mycobacterium tuberculosis]
GCFVRFIEFGCLATTAMYQSTVFAFIVKRFRVFVRRFTWRSIEDVELATARWVDWFNHRRLYQYCGDVPPVELEAAYYAQRQRPAAG